MTKPMISNRPLYLISSVIRPEEKSILNAAKQYGFEVRSVLLNKAHFAMEEDEQGHATERTAQQPFALIRTPAFFAGCQLASIYEANGFRVFNDASVLNLFGQKIQSDAWLKANELPYIPSTVVFCEAQLAAAADLIGFPLVMKPSIGGFGKLVHIIRDIDELRNVAEQLLTFAPSSHKSILLQQYVKIKHDIRAIVIGNRLVAAYERCLPPGSKNCGPRNVAQGAIGHRFDLDGTDILMLTKLAQKARSSCLGIDLLIDKDGKRFICDVNPVCRFEEAVRVTGVDIAAELLSHLAGNPLRPPRVAYATF